MADASIKNRLGGRLLLFGFSVVVWSLAAWPLSFGLVFLGVAARNGWHKRKARRRADKRESKLERSRGPSFRRKVIPHDARTRARVLVPKRSAAAAAVWIFGRRLVAGGLAAIVWPCLPRRGCPKAKKLQLQSAKKLQLK
jgi:hypothetical protein